MKSKSNSDGFFFLFAFIKDLLVSKTVSVIVHFWLGVFCLCLLLIIRDYIVQTMFVVVSCLIYMEQSILLYLLSIDYIQRCVNSGIRLQIQTSECFLRRSQSVSSMKLLTDLFKFCDLCTLLKFKLCSYEQNLIHDHF